MNSTESFVSLVLLMSIALAGCSSLHALGQRRAAEDRLAELNEAWPGAPLDLILHQVYAHDEHADQVIDRLLDLGWKPTAVEAAQ